MKNLIKCVMPLLGVVLVGGAVVAAPKGPMGPSAKAAARLKQNPPNNWIRHYLPEDRYKLGAAWKYVTTELDTYYHRPSCPNMLRQTASRVIGFENIREAEEAGYFPDRSCSHSGFSGAGGAVAATGTVTLADGASRLRIPTGWRRIQSNGMSIFGMKMGRDVFTSSKGGRVEIQTGDIAGLAKQFPDMPLAKTDLAELLTVAGLNKNREENRRVISSVQSTSRIDSRTNSAVTSWSQAMDGTVLKEARIGGRKGVAMLRQANSGRAPRTYWVGKGTKYLGVAHYGNRAAEAAVFLKNVRVGF